MPDGLTVDFKEFNAATKRALEMGEVRKRDIADIFRRSNRPVISLAKSTIQRSRYGGYASRGKKTGSLYTSRAHTPGNLKRSIGFKVSRKYMLTYWVRPKAWYSAIYAGGHGTWGGNPFMERAWAIAGESVTNNIRRELGKLIQGVWSNG